MSTDWTTDVNRFMLGAGQFVPDGPSIMSAKEQVLRLTLIKDELDELAIALRDDDLAALADACIDLNYITIGTLLCSGINPRPIWDMVHKANMSKFKHQLLLNEMGKCMKPVGWKHPDIEKEIERQKNLFGKTGLLFTP